MNHAAFRFYEELNEFLPVAMRKRSVMYNFSGSPSIKDAIEAQGVPHVEVDLILVNSNPVDFSYKLKNGDNVSVYPVFESLDISPISHLRAEPLRKVRFVLDVHLGKLSRFLRLFGFDSLYRSDYKDNEIVSLSIAESRIILTRDVGLLKTRQVTHGYWLRSQILDEQIKEVFKRFDLARHILPFSRCMECNGLIVEISKEDISDHLFPATLKYFDRFWQCPDCHRIYWEGSHYERMRKYIEYIIKDVN